MFNLSVLKTICVNWIDEFLQDPVKWCDKDKLTPSTCKRSLIFMAVFDLWRRFQCKKIFYLLSQKITDDLVFMIHSFDDFLPPPCFDLLPYFCPSHNDTCYILTLKAGSNSRRILNDFKQSVECVLKEMFYKPWYEVEGVKQSFLLLCQVGHVINIPLPLKQSFLVRDLKKKCVFVLPLPNNEEKEFWEKLIESEFILWQFEGYLIRSEIEKDVIVVSFPRLSPRITRKRQLK